MTDQVNKLEQNFPGIGTLAQTFLVPSFYNSLFAIICFYDELTGANLNHHNVLVTIISLPTQVLAHSRHPRNTTTEMRASCLGSSLGTSKLYGKIMTHGPQKVKPAIQEKFIYLVIFIVYYSKGMIPKIFSCPSYTRNLHADIEFLPIFCE